MTYTYTMNNQTHHIQASSYKQALGAIPHITDREIVSISETFTRGKKDGRSFRDFLVDTKPKGTPQKVIYFQGEHTSEIIRVYGSFSGRSLSL